VRSAGVAFDDGAFDAGATSSFGGDAGADGAGGASDDGAAGGSFRGGSEAPLGTTGGVAGGQGSAADARPAKVPTAMDIAHGSTRVGIEARAAFISGAAHMSTSTAASQRALGRSKPS